MTDPAALPMRSQTKLLTEVEKKMQASRSKSKFLISTYTSSSTTLLCHIKCFIHHRHCLPDKTVCLLRQDDLSRNKSAGLIWMVWQCILVENASKTHVLRGITIIFSSIYSQLTLHATFVPDFIFLLKPFWPWSNNWQQFIGAQCPQDVATTANINHSKYRVLHYTQFEAAWKLTEA